MLYSLASLSAKELEAIQSLEKRIGKQVLALRQMKIEYDDLPDEAVGEIQRLEVELGLALVAVK